MNLPTLMDWNLFVEHINWLWKVLNIGSKTRIYAQFGVHLTIVIDAETEHQFLK